ncbi:MAG TPA: DUF4397 domain-containing protein [Trueperaceae bacterium]|nr:DUF4397 domain-containing protein [Trueperaceae bacterium]
MSDYVAIAPGDYEVSVNLAAVEGEDAGAIEVPADALDTFAGEYYTIMLMGVVPPDEGAADEGGFFEWLSGLFTADDDRFTLRAMVMSDLTQFGVAEGEAEVRIVHAAPGTEAVDLVLVRDDDVDVVLNVGYGDVSGFEAIPADAGTLELRVAGSEAAILDLSDQQLEGGTSNTLLLIGTPVEEVPLEVIVAPNPVASTTAVTPAAPGAVAPAIATDRTWLRDSINELEARLAAIEERLRNLADVEGAEEDVNAALQEVAEAMALLNDARDQMAAQPASMPATEPAPATDEPETTDPDGDGN